MTIENVKCCAFCNLPIKDLQRGLNAIGKLHCGHEVHTVCIRSVRADPALKEICLFCLLIPSKTSSLNTSLIEFKKNVQVSYRIGYEGAPDLVAIAIFFSGMSLMVNPFIKIGLQKTVNETDVKQKPEEIQEFLYTISLLCAYRLSRKCTGRELGSYKIVRMGVGTTAAILSVIAYPFSRCLSLKNRLHKIE